MVGGGNSAAQAALHFARYASKVTMVLREDRLTEIMSQYLADRIRATPNIEVLLRTEVVALRRRSGAARGHAARTTRPARSGSWRRAGCFSASAACRIPSGRRRSASSATRPAIWSPARICCRNGQRPANWPLNRDPYYLETNVPGVFAAGDVRHGSVKRFASAVGEGAMAVTFVHRYLMSG